MPGKGEASAVICHNGLFSSQAGPVSDHVAPFFVCPGALAGAAIGGDSKGAAIGAGAGLLMGSATGTDASRASTVGTQRQYDNAYIQCMYAKGHRVPVPANMSYSAPVRSPVQSQPRDPSIPPPPPGAPPPPPIR